MKLELLRDIACIPLFLVLFVIAMLYAVFLWIISKFGVEV